MSSWVTIRTFIYPQEAYVAKSFLESEGITVFLKDELTTQVHNFYSNALGGVKLQVVETEYDLGIELLKKGGFIKSKDELKEEIIEIIEVDKTTIPESCPFCNSKNIGKKTDPNLLAVFVYFLLGVLFPIFKASYICYDCEMLWKFKKRA